MQKKCYEVLTICVFGLDSVLMNDLFYSFLLSEEYELTSATGNGETWIYVFSATDGSETHTVTI